MAKCGRRCVLDEKRKSRIVALLKSGCSRGTAASAVGCDPKTILNTAKRDPDFAEKLALAENAAELLHLDNINKAGRDTKYWRASAWMLAHLNPDRYGTSNPDAITPSQMIDLIVQIAEIIIQEVPVAKYRQEVLKRFDHLLAQAHLFSGTIPNAPQKPRLIELSPTVPETPDHEPD
jgi:hypothetical protein